MKRVDVHFSCFLFSRIFKTARSIQNLLDVAIEPNDLNITSLRLHRLKGKYIGLWSVRVSGNWRIIFRIESGDAYDVELIDYH